MEKYKIEDKEIFNLAWNYFSLLAKQRVTYFNFFIVLISVITTAVITSFQRNLNIHIVGISLGLMECFFCFIFWKIDVRNKYLTKHTENAIKCFEVEYEHIELKIFTIEEEKTNELRESQKKKFFFNRQLSHSKLYITFYIVFFIIGLLGSIVSLILQLSK